MAIYPLVKSTKLFTSYVHNSMVKFIWNIKFSQKIFLFLTLRVSICLSIIMEKKDKDLIEPF